MYSGSQPPFHRSAITQKYAYKTQRSCLFKKHLYRRHRSVSVEKGDSGRSGVRGGIVKKKSRLRRISPGGRAGAANRTRTGDLRITNASLYQLSYCGFPYIQNEPRCSHRGSYSKKAATYSPTN